MINNLRVKKIILYLIVFVFIAGCGDSVLLLMNKDKYFAKRLKYTKKAEINNYFQTVAILNATNLSKSEPEKYKQPTYFIGVYIENDFDNNQSGLYNPNFKLTLNEQTAKSIKVIDENTLLFKNMPFTNRWSNYYVVTFDKVDDEKERLRFLDLRSSRDISLIF